MNFFNQFVAHAAPYPLSVPIPGATPITTVSNPVEYINAIYMYSVGIAGALAFLVLVYSGVRYILAAGNPGEQEAARHGITRTLLGLLLLLGAVLLLDVIDPNLKNLELLKAPSIDKIKTPPAPTPGKQLAQGIKDKVAAAGGDLQKLHALFNEIKTTNGIDATKTTVELDAFFTALNINGNNIELYQYIADRNNPAATLSFVRAAIYNGGLANVPIWNSLTDKESADFYITLLNQNDRRAFIEDFHQIPDGYARLGAVYQTVKSQQYVKEFIGDLSQVQVAGIYDHLGNLEAKRNFESDVRLYRNDFDYIKKFY